MRQIGLSVCIICVLLNSDVFAQPWQTDGNLKYRLQHTRYPSNSVFRDLVGSDASDHSLSARFNISLVDKQWSANVSYQLIGLYADSLEYSRDSANAALFRSPIQNDDARLIDLQHVFDDDGKRALVGRADRFNLTYKNDNNVIKLGRQAISWGNGLTYAPMDFFNPFDPAAIDVEYKTGDDMLYAQHLFNNGSDLQLAWVLRRNENQGTSQDVNSVALKYHGFIGSNEYDLLVSRHYDDTIFGVGGAFSIGGSVIRGDWVVTDTGDQRFNNVVANISYSWVTWKKNFTGSLEYFHNDFGLSQGELGLSQLGNNQELLNRIARGELFTLSRDYVAGSLLVEMAPLWQLTSNVFYNLSDNSAFTQVVSQHDITQNAQLIMALSAPIGPEGTEFGGFLTSVSEAEKFSSNDWSLFAQLAWYF